MANQQLIEFLKTRRSVVANNMTGPGPDEAELKSLLTIAARVPDHGKLAPWRFIVFSGDAREIFGEVLARAFVHDNPDAGAERVAFERGRFLRAPVVVAVVSAAVPHAKIPEWEQVLSAGAVCQTLLIAAGAMGYAGQWITEWYAYDKDIAGILGLKEAERIAGFVYIGSTREPPTERARPDIDEITTHWPPPG